jgi:GH15 family glucan-1,4-alpha-glucosidase
MRIDGQPVVRDLAAIGDKRTVALISLDGAVEWMCLPRFDDPPVFGTLLDPDHGGRLTLRPTEPFEATRRYLPGTNVLETTFTTAAGRVRVTDTLALAGEVATPYTELIRRLDGEAGRVELAWHVEPRCGFDARPPELMSERADVPILRCGALLVSVQSLDAGEPTTGRGAAFGRVTLAEGDTAALVVGGFHRQPVGLCTKETAFQRVDATVQRWERWSGQCGYDGPWPEAVHRSMLALDLLVDDDTGALVAAPTTSLPERIGGSRNYDYRFGWLRDANLTLEAFMRMGYDTQVQASMTWMLRSIGATSPLLRPIHRLDGRPRVPQRELDLPGYRGSRPVHAGNNAEQQLQLGNWGDLLDATWHYVRLGHVLDPESVHVLTDALDYLCRVWRRTDASIWELGDRRHYTQSKLACWIALRRGVELAAERQLPQQRADRWREEADAIRSFVEEHCWSERHGAWTRAADDPDELDAAVLLASRSSFIGEDPQRLSSTVDAIARELGAGRGLLYRCTGMREQEGAFLACSFWMVEALVRAQRLDEAGDLMDELVAHVNDVGLLSEEMDPETGELLGNFPQALSHLALVNAADVVREALEQAGRVRAGSLAM